MIVLSGLMLVSGCGQASKGLDSKDNMGTLSKAEKSQNGGALYQKYQGKFPENLMQITAEDYMKKWPNTGYVIQEADGTEVVAYSTAETFKEVLDAVEESYPTFNEDAYVQEEADKFAAENHIMNATSLEDTGLSEEEITTELQKRLQEKMAWIAAEKRFITFSEMTSPEVQNKIMANVARVNGSVAHPEAQYFEIGSKGQVVFTKLQTKMLLDSYLLGFVTLGASSKIAVRTVAAALIIGKTIHDWYGEDNKKNAFVHSYWAALTGTACNDIPFIGPSVGEWWGYEFTAAREELRDGAGMMDLHNDKVGSKVFRDYSDQDWHYIKIKIGWFKVKIPIWYYASTDVVGMTSKLKQMSNDAQRAWWDMNQGAWRDKHKDEGGVVISKAPDHSRLIYFRN